MSIEELNIAICEFLRKRRRDMGVIGGGLFNYYDAKLKNNTALGALDIAIILAVIERYPYRAKIHEMACGMAQIGHVLALNGYDVTASEIMPKRYEAALALGAELKSPCTIVQGDSLSLDIDVDVVVIGNAVSGLIDSGKHIDRIAAIVAGGVDVIMSIDLFGSKVADTRKALASRGIDFFEIGNGIAIIYGERNVTASK